MAWNPFKRKNSSDGTNTQPPTKPAEHLEPPTWEELLDKYATKPPKPNMDEEDDELEERSHSLGDTPPHNGSHDANDHWVRSVRPKPKPDLELDPMRNLAGRLFEQMQLLMNDMQLQEQQLLRHRVFGHFMNNLNPSPTHCLGIGLDWDFITRQLQQREMEWREQEEKLDTAKQYVNQLKAIDKDYCTIEHERLKHNRERDRDIGMDR